ncbi:hypothetical protein CR513_57424, partial [Mucuna pruriens]
MTLVPEEDLWWTLYVDGSSNQKGGGAGIILEGLIGITLEHSLKFNSKAFNNQVAYKALLAGLDLAREVRAWQMHYHIDSQVMAKHIKGTYQVKDPLLLRCEVQHVPRINNSRPDTFARLAIAKTLPWHTALHRVFPSPIVDIPEILHAETKD